MNRGMRNRPIWVWVALVAWLSALVIFSMFLDNLGVRFSIPLLIGIWALAFVPYAVLALSDVRDRRAMNAR